MTDTPERGAGQADGEREPSAGVGGSAGTGGGGGMDQPLKSSDAAFDSAADSAAQDAANLDLVMDVELNVTLRFGQRSLSLREVLELSSGSVIELDRQVDDPVELLLDGRVIARGEAVVIDGHYGLRVTDIPRPYGQPGAGEGPGR